MEQGTDANGFDDINGEGSSNEEHRNDKSFACDARDELTYLRIICQKVGVDEYCHNKEQDKPWNTDFLAFAAEDDRSDQCQRDDPQGTGEFDGRRHLQGFFAISGTCADYGTGVMDSNSCPCAEVLLAESQPMTQNREEEQPNGVKDKHRRQCHRHIGIFGFDDRSYGSNGTTATDSSARTDEVGSVAVEFQYFATDKHADEQSANDGYNRKEHTFLTRCERGLEIHAKAQTDDGVLEEFFGYVLIESGIGLSAKQGKN